MNYIVKWSTSRGHTVEVYTDEAGQHRWRLRAGNNKIVAHGESYTRRFDAVAAAHDLFPEDPGEPGPAPEPLEAP